MKRLAGLACGVVLALAAPAQAGELDQPHFAPGDSWVYDIVVAKKGVAPRDLQTEFAVSRLEGDRMLVSISTVGSSKPPIEHLSPLDWSRERSVNGVETVVNRPLAFPLALGKSWRVDFTEVNPTVQIAREESTTVYKVDGWETIKTPAGEFKTLKIEGNGNWVADTSPRVISNAVVGKSANGGAASRVDKNVIAARRVTGRIYRVLYYAPTVKRWVKSLEETYDNNDDVANSETSELKAYHAGSE